MVPFFTSVATDHKVFVRASANTVDWQIYKLGLSTTLWGCYSLSVLWLLFRLLTLRGSSSSWLLVWNGIFWCLARSSLIFWSYLIFIIWSSLGVRLVCNCLWRVLLCQSRGLISYGIFLLVCLILVLHPCQLVIYKFVYVKLISIKKSD